MKKLYSMLLPCLMAVAPMAAMADCHDCGRVTNISAYTGHSNGTGGAVAGAVVGGLLGHQVGGGNGKTLATVAGVAGGAVVGKRIAENHAKTKYRVTVRMDQGYTKTVTQSNVGNISVGSHVRVRHGTAVRL
jgi:outer membrane lipoprotein SlyB